MSDSPLRIASRGSELALWQAHHVRGALLRARPGAAVEIGIIRTTGDRILDVPLAKIGDRGLFTKEIDAAILAGEADVAVHSLKDVPTRLPDGLVLAAVSRRADPRDVVLCGPGHAGLNSLPAGARVGTSSLRRVAQLRALRPDLQVADLRGNLNTRLGKLDAGQYDAILLAAAGVLRLGWDGRITEYLDPATWLPAVGQGALAIVARADDAAVLSQLAPLHDEPTASCVAAERTLLRALEGGCQVPIGALATRGGDVLHLHAMIASLDGSTILRDHETGPSASAVDLGTRLADRLHAAGGAAILAELRAMDAAAPRVPPP